MDYLAKYNRNSGFSLLELLLYVAVLAIITTFITGAFFSINQGRARVESATEVNSNLRFAIEKITQDIKHASSVAVPSIAGETTNSIELSISGTTITYCMVNGHVRRQSGGTCTGASDSITSDTVIANTLAFTRVENANAALGKTFVTISVSLGLRYNSDTPEWQYAATKQTNVSIY